jgi:hypothetical protein
MQATAYFNTEPGTVTCSPGAPKPKLEKKTHTKFGGVVKLEAHIRIPFRVHSKDQK